jgi:predicted phage baseplate assembly protein
MSSTAPASPQPSAGAAANGAIAVRTPAEITNRPGLSALGYRAGVHWQFKETMLANLGGVPGLGARNDQDFSVALIDAFACVADTLTFYQERIANESYLSTAKERVSLLELGRLIGYRARPGVAAASYLAFTVEDAPGAPDLAAPPVNIDVGLKVQSFPAQGHAPMTFETVESIVARPEFNAIRPQLSEEQTISVATRSILLKGASLNVQPGDIVLLSAGDDPDERTALEVMSVVAQPDKGTTLVSLAIDPPLPPRPRPRPIIFSTFRSDYFRLTTDRVRSSVLSVDWRQADLDAYVRVQRWPERALAKNIKWQAAQRSFPPEIGIFVFRARAAVFGHNAPAQGATTPGLPDGATLQSQSEPPNLAQAVDLDRTYPGIVAGSWVVLKSPTSDYLVRQADGVFELSRASFGLSAKVSRVLLDTDDGFDQLTVRETTVFAASEKLELADLPIDDDVEGASVTLQDVCLGLDIGRKVIVSGERSDLRGVIDNELMTLAEVNLVNGRTALVFQQELTGSYLRNTVAINANVALATHGETVTDTLGSGDANAANLRLPLAQQPLTYVSSASPSGADSTLQVCVNDLAWLEAPSFFDRGPNERIYVTQNSNDGVTTVVFGNGVNGARVPSGSENVRASYRKGIGAVANVDANRLSLIPSRPQGVRSVTNPLAATGGADPEGGASIRTNAPLAILTIDRIVSLQDYEDFARAFAGIGKAMASPWVWAGHGRGVFLTVAGPSSEAIEPGSPTYANLLDAIGKAAAPNAPVEVQSYRSAFFTLSGTVFVSAEYSTDDVLAAVKRALRDRFSFQARAFGQRVTLGEVMATIQAVSGVVAVDIDSLSRVDNIALSPRLERGQRKLVRTRFGLIAEDDQPSQTLASAVPQMRADGTLLAAELLTLDPRPIDLKGETA